MNARDKQRIKEYWDEAHEKQLKTAISQNEELRKLFEAHPEKKELYKLKILDSEVTESPTPPDDICCKDCIFQLPPISIDGKTTSRYNWGKCKLLNEKPYEILYGGAKCEFKEKE